MTSNLWTLLHAQYQNQSTVNVLRFEKDKKKRGKAIGMLCAYTLVAVMLMVYSFIMAYGYGYLNMAYVIPGFALVISSVIALFFTFLKTNGFLFAYKDYDMIMALPVSTRTVITAKFLYMYINNLLFSLGLMLPMSIAYGIWRRPGTMVYIIWFLGACVAPLIPMSVAAAVGALIAAIGSKFRFKVLVQVILSVLLMMAIFGLSFFLGGDGSDAQALLRIEELGEMLQTQLHKIYPVAAWFDTAVNDGNVLALLGVLAVSAAVYGIFVSVVAVKYKAINTALMTSGGTSHYEITQMKSGTMMSALIRKEWKRFTSSVTYLMNMGIGLILAVAACIACVVVGIDKVLSEMQLGNMQQSLVYILPFIIGMMLTMSCTTCVSLSLEGKNLWILKSLPIEEAMIYKSKMAFNLLLLTPAAIVCNICLAIALRLHPMMILLYLLVSFAGIGFSTTFGMCVGKRFANFGWENEVEVIKQGMASMMGILVNMILQIILAAASFGMSQIMDGRLAMLMISVILLAVDAFFYRLAIRGNHYSS